jgi:hypothetical protein
LRLQLLKAGARLELPHGGAQSFADVFEHFRPDRNRPDDPVIASALCVSQ